MPLKKSIVLGDGRCQVEDLKTFLGECNDNSYFKLKLCIDEPQKENAVVSRLEDLCSDLHRLLVAASICVDKCAAKEKNGHKTIYYEGDKGYNCGARQLAKDIREMLNNYCKERVQIDLYDRDGV